MPMSLRYLRSSSSSGAGDFFEGVPAAGSYLLEHVLHDRDDVSCRSILSNIRSFLRPGARLVIVEMLVTDSSANTGAWAFRCAQHGRSIGRMSPLGAGEELDRRVSTSLQEEGLHRVAHE
jgi:hypothetical protein